MTLTQVFTRFLKEYLPQGAYNSWIIALTNRNVKRWSYRRLNASDRMRRIQSYRRIDSSYIGTNLCFFYLLDNSNGRNVYGICGRLVEDYLETCFQHIKEDDFLASVVSTYRKLWREFIDEYVILPKKPSCFYSPFNVEDVKMVNSFGIKKSIERCALSRYSKLLIYDKMIKPWER